MNRADLFAIVAGCRAGERRVLDLCERFGKETYLAALQALLDRTYEAMRTLIRLAIPEEPQTLRGLHRRRRARQRPVQDEADDLARGRARLLRLDGHRPAGAGADQLLPLRGHVQDVHRDLPDHGQRSPDPLQRRLLSAAARRHAGGLPAEAALPGGARLPHARARPPVRRARRRALQEGAGAEHGGRLRHVARTCSTRAGTASGEFFYSMEILYGGIPGRPIGDGMDGHSWWPLFENIPTEYLEAYYPLRIDGYTTIKDSGGAGFHRGGNGVEKRYVYLEPGEVSIHDDRWLTRPWGVLGGQPGERSEKILRRADGTEERLPSKCDNVVVEPGDMLVYRTAGGGGWKDRLDRPVEAVVRDVALGLVSREKALRELRRRRRRRRRGRRGGDREPSASASAPSAARRSRSTSGRRSRRRSRTARRRPASSRRRRRSRCAGRRSRTGRDARARARARGGASVSRAAVRGLRAAGRRRRAAARARRHRHEQRLHRPGIAARVRPRRRRSRRSGSCSTRRGAPRSRSSTRPSRTARATRSPRRRSSRRCRRCSRSRPGSSWVEIDERLAPRPDEPVLNKLFASAFFGTPFASLLASHGCDSVIVTGASTSGCVRATAVDALQHGYRPVVPREAVGDRNPAAHDADALRHRPQVRRRRLARRVPRRAGGARCRTRSLRRSCSPTPTPTTSRPGDVVTVRCDVVMANDVSGPGRVPGDGEDGRASGSSTRRRSSWSPTTSCRRRTRRSAELQARLQATGRRSRASRTTARAAAASSTRCSARRAGSCPAR